VDIPEIKKLCAGCKRKEQAKSYILIPEGVKTR